MSFDCTSYLFGLVFIGRVSVLILMSSYLDELTSPQFYSDQLVYESKMYITVIMSFFHQFSIL